MKAPSNQDPNFECLQSLLDSIPHTQTFKGKWSLIATKLHDLKTHLSDLSDYPLTSLSMELHHSLSCTLSHALSLSKASHTPTLPAGKLQTQNDINSILAKLDNHIQDCQVLIKSGLLVNDTVGLRNLITRLQIGTTQSRNLAMDSLLGLLQEDDKNVLVAVAQGVVPVLVRLLDSSSSSDIKEKTVAAIAIVSLIDSGKHVLITEGLLLVHDLLRVVESGSGFAKEKACVALQALTHSKENARSIGSRGGISSLLEICQSGTPSSQAVAAAVLRNLSRFLEIKENFVEENGVLILLGLLASGTCLAQENAIGCLCNLVLGDDDLKLLVGREGGIESLKNFWDSVSVGSSLEVAVELLSNLASCPPIAEVIVSDGFLSRIMNVLSCGVLGVRIAAARAAYNLGFNSKIRKELGECGCISSLVLMLEGKAVEEKEAAAMAISSILLQADNRRIFRKEERGIVSVVQLLDPLLQNLDKKYPVSILVSLVHSKKCRKEMAALGACAYLQKLVEMEVEGAKKLLDSLGRGKLWGVFTRP